MGLKPGSSAAGSFWRPAKNKRLLQEWGKGRSAATIGKAIGISRNAVLGRLLRLRRAGQKTGATGYARADAARAAAVKKLAHKQREIIRAMRKAIASGMTRGQAMTRAARAGASWVQIGDHFGISAQNAYATGKAWAQRHQRAAATRERKAARLERQRKLIADMSRAVKRGMLPEQAMARAHRAGATWARIAAHFGISQQTAHYRAKIWTKQARPVRAFHRRRKRR